jgi:hypothetical protein
VLPYDEIQSWEAKMTAVPIRYWIFRWSPPELSEAERLWVGREISRVGRQAVIRCFKQHMSDTITNRDSGGFSVSDVLRDAELYSNPGYRKQVPTLRAKVIAIIFFGACFAFLLATGLLAFALIAIAFVLPVSLGSMWWSTRKFENWVASVIDDYSHATTCPKVNQTGQAA